MTLAIILSFLFLIMILASMVIFLASTHLTAILIYGLLSLGSVGIFIILKAPDVAITEAAIGVVLTMILLLISLRRMEEDLDH